MPDTKKERTMALAPIEEALKRIRRGEMVLVVDDEDRENEGDLQMAASWVTQDALNFMLRWARGLICMPAAPEVIDSLQLTPMVAPEIAGCDTPFTVPIDHVDGGSGISAADRALTIRRCVDSDARPAEFRRPGHVFPLRARAGGTLERRGHTESAVDLAVLAGLPPVAVTCEVLDDDGEAACFEVLLEFAERHRIAMCSIDQIAEHRRHVDVGARRPAPLLL
jgi:3,4-dihydroxy 2-butanone 4-phosphate synthase/GTP cyclohydrolase II